MYFPQVHPPGREAQFDFTHCGELKVTIAGQSYPHLLFQLILSHSGWRYAEVAAGETFLALQQGLQNALWTLGGVPEVVRSDNTSAATHELRSSRGRALNDNYGALLDHYGLRSTRINPGQSHENGVAEHAHYRLKDAIDRVVHHSVILEFDVPQLPDQRCSATGPVRGGDPAKLIEAGQVATLDIESGLSVDLSSRFHLEMQDASTLPIFGCDVYRRNARTSRCSERVSG